MASDGNLRKLLASVEGRRLNRRELVQRGAAIGLGSSALAAGLASVTGRQAAQASAARWLLQEAPGSGVKGGELKSATIGEPPTLDEHQTTANITAAVGYCMYETLYTYDSKYLPIPELAESDETSPDGLTMTIKLRQNVPFHNGETMTAGDVIASIERWGQISGVGKNLMASVNSLDKVDDHTIQFKFKQPYGTVKIALSHNTQACTIHPKSVLDKFGLKPLTEYVGTGPYKLTQWKPDAYILFSRFDKYAALTTPPNGYGGKKYAYFDTIRLIPVPDEASRVSGLQAGDYQIGEEISNQQYSVLKNAPGIVAKILTPSNWDVFFLNWKSPMMSKLAMRQAFQATLDMEPILLAGRGPKQFIRLNPGLMMLQTPWYTDAGNQYYNMHNPTLAKQKLQEAGYNGEPLRFLATQDYAYMYGQAVVAKQQLEKVGFKVDLQVTDWATVVQKRAKPNDWDAFVTGHGFVPDPSQISYVGQMDIYPGWWSAPDSLKLASQLLSETTFEKRYPIWKQIQSNAYTQIPACKTGDSSNCAFYSDKLGGWTDQIDFGIPYWNLWLKK
jgi:peptide/nickel transport system substrate-binding protein